jgi:hypothetical protein
MALLSTHQENARPPTISFRGWCWIGASAFGIWAWYEIITIAVGISKYCYCLSPYS